MIEKSRRAKSMSRAERRAMILDATIPLLIEHGRAVTSKQIAGAAGIAEGTVFRVFDDKDALIAAAVDRHIEANSIVESIAAIPEELPLRERIHAVVVLLQYRVRAIFGLMASLGFAPPTGPDAERMQKLRERGHGHSHGDHPGASRFSEPAVNAIADLLTPDRERLALPPRRSAQLIRVVTLSMTHPLLTDGESFSAEEITDFLINGCVQHPEPVPSSVAASQATAVTV